jgi:methionyl-tRNA formyltransferase
MFDTIILLTGPAEQPILAEVLRRQNSRLTVHAVETLPALEALDPGLFPRARLIGFATPTVVLTQILERLGFGGYNFHPGPPHYPGWVPAHSAIYDGAAAHIMIERVDAGPIVGVEQFGIPPHTGVVGLEELAYAQLAQLFWRLANMLAAQSEPLPVLPVPWSGKKSTRRSFAAMCEIQNDISKKELERRIEAIGVGKLDLLPTITLHGHRFGYIAPDAETIVDAPSIVPAEPLTAVPA